jgi:hypothetical protein
MAARNRGKGQDYLAIVTPADSRLFSLPNRKGVGLIMNQPLKNEFKHF